MEIDSPFSERQAARYIGTSDTTLRMYRYAGTGPTYYRPGERLIRYRKSDLDTWINERLNQPVTAEKSG